MRKETTDISMASGYRKINPEVKKEYLEWLMTPPSERSPSTKLDMAEQLGVTQRTLYNWENTEEFQSQLRTLKAKWGTRWYGDILGRMKSIIDDGSDKDAISAARVLLGHLHVDVDEKGGEVSDDEVAAIREALEAGGYNVVKRNGAD